ncbi:MAG TPA: hypothetical protein VJX67_10370, partial [Blastocatellia bacterium]|nr:hypothetical protein [Blastocatellia bacterium]
MKERSKWMLAAVGFTFGLQVLISLAFTRLAYSAARSGSDVPAGTASILVLGFTLGTFLVGGLVVGWMNEKLRIGDASIVTAFTLLLTALIFWPMAGQSRAQFVSASWLSDENYNLAVTGHGAIFIVLAL